MISGFFSYWLPAQNRERAAIEAQREEEHFKLRQFEDAPSKVRRDLQRREEVRNSQFAMPGNALHLPITCLSDMPPGQEQKAKGDSPENSKSVEHEHCSCCCTLQPPLMYPPRGRFLRAHQREDKLDELALQAKQRTKQRERAPRKSSLPAEVKQKSCATPEDSLDAGVQTQGCGDSRGT